MTETVDVKKKASVQELCIDLPGEAVQCWRSSDNIKVVLRKHRDVIFDLKLGKGKTYTVHSAESDFYNARDKKLVIAKQKEKIKFADGERLHLWVTRNFKGSLILMEGNNVLLKISPEEMDQSQYDNNPKTKPSPIIISMVGSATNKVPLPQKNGVLAEKIPITQSANALVTNVAPKHSAAPVEYPLVCVLEGEKKGIPEKILELINFKKGGGDSGLVDIDPNDVATRNWIFGQVAGTAAYAVDNWEWLKACIEKKAGKEFKIIKAKLRYNRGKLKFYFSGYTNANAVFGRGGYGPSNSKFMSIFAGVGSTKSSFIANAKGVVGSFKGFAGISFLFGSATTYAEWKDDASKDGYDLASSLLMGLIKTLIVAVIAGAVIAAILAIALIGFAATVPIIVIGALSVSVSLGVNYIVEASDKKLGKVISGQEKNGDGLGALLAPVLRNAGKEIGESWEYLMKKFPKDYEWIEF